MLQSCVCNVSRFSYCHIHENELKSTAIILLNICDYCVCIQQNKGFKTTIKLYFQKVLVSRFLR